MSQWLMFSAEAQMSEKPFSDGLPEAFRRASGCFFEKSSISEPIFRAENCGNKKIRLSLHPQQGGLAQLARALAWHARGHEFESRILHFDPRQIGDKRRQIPQNQGFAGFSFLFPRHPKDTKKPRSDKVALLKPLLKRLWNFSNDLRHKSLICSLLS